MDSIVGPHIDVDEQELTDNTTHGSAVVLLRLFSLLQPEAYRFPMVGLLGLSKRRRAEKVNFL
jgi:hypothetical protein